MATIDVGNSVSSQLNAGASILAAARAVDTRLVKARLAAFERAQRSYSAAHDKVGAAEAALNAAITQLGELNADQGEAVDALARVLIAEGAPRTNPFRAFGPLAPGKLIAQRNGDGVKAVHQLVTAVQRAKGISKLTLQAAQAVERAARAVEQQLAQIEKLRDTAREARHTRDAMAQTWATELAAFKRGAAPPATRAHRISTPHSSTARHAPTASPASRPPSRRRPRHRRNRQPLPHRRDRRRSRHRTQHPEQILARRNYQLPARHFETPRPPSRQQGVSIFSETALRDAARRGRLLRVNGKVLVVSA